MLFHRSFCPLELARTLRCVAPVRFWKSANTVVIFTLCTLRRLRAASSPLPSSCHKTHRLAASDTTGALVSLAAQLSLSATFDKQRKRQPGRGNVSDTGVDETSVRTLTKHHPAVSSVPSMRSSSQLRRSQREVWSGNSVTAPHLRSKLTMTPYSRCPHKRPPPRWRFPRRDARGFVSARARESGADCAPADPEHHIAQHCIAMSAL